MTQDHEHLQFIYDRMKNVHGESENIDYMLRFASIIRKIKDVENAQS